jgi:hypothetical protein
VDGHFRQRRQRSRRPALAAEFVNRSAGRHARAALTVDTSVLTSRRDRANQIFSQIEVSGADDMRSDLDSGGAASARRGSRGRRAA